jgi:cadmium resistance protein CadD (predicted permease)
MEQNGVFAIAASILSLVAFYFMFKQINYRTNFVSKMSGLKLIFFMIILLVIPATLMVIRPESAQLIATTIGLLPLGLYLLWANLKSADKQAQRKPKARAINEKVMKESINKDKSYSKTIHKNQK